MDEVRVVAILFVKDVVAAGLAASDSGDVAEVVEPLNPGRDQDQRIGCAVGVRPERLARLRLNGLIARRPGTNTYDLTPDGQRVAIFYTKVHDRLLRPLIAADGPPAPVELRRALTTIDRHVHAYTDSVRIGTAA